jgi:hypothetical protein
LNLDLDKSGDKAKDGGVAVKHSMEKYTLGKREWSIGGGSSDAGRGFTGKAMKKTLVAEKLADAILYIHVNCTSHNDQTNLRVSIEKVYGSGGRDKRNVCQLIHAFSDTQQLFDKVEVNPIMRSAWRFKMGDAVEVPRDFMELMQEPILTRWGTVGEACQYVEKYFDVLVTFGKGLCGSTNKSSNLALCAGNFLSLAQEEEIAIDLSFLSDFDKVYFKEHLDFNHAKDPNVGRPGFVPNHHLVRYCLKRQELEKIVVELDAGTVDKSPDDAKLKRFWGRITGSTNGEAKAISLKKARDFITEFWKSLVKHNDQFVSPDLLFLGAFGEPETSLMVAKMLQCASENPEPELCVNKLLVGADESRPRTFK